MSKAQAALEDLAKQVKSNHKTLTEPEIIGRIMIISGRSFTQACKGYEIMIAGKLFDKFVSKDGYGALARMIDRNPAILEAFEVFDLIPQTCEVREYRGWERPRVISQDRAMITLPDPTF